MDDGDASLRRTMSYQKTNSNLLQWDQHECELITNDDVENYINNQMFYGMFPSIGIVSPEAPYGQDQYWDNTTLYERDRDLFKKYIPIIKEISIAGWEPIPYATCDNPEIMFERYGGIDEGLYYTVSNSGSESGIGTLTIDLQKLGFDENQVEVRELVTDTSHMLDIQNGKLFLTIIPLNPHDTWVYRIVS